MCLSKVYPYDKTKDLPNAGVGWKVFRVVGGGLTPPLHGSFDRPTVTDGWQASERKPLDDYLSGWHIYKHRRAAYLYLSDARESIFNWNSAFTVRKVRWVGRIATGELCGDEVIVAEYMLVPNRNWFERVIDRIIESWEA